MTTIHKTDDDSVLTFRPGIDFETFEAAERREISRDRFIGLDLHKGLLVKLREENPELEFRVSEFDEKTVKLFLWGWKYYPCIVPGCIGHDPSEAETFDGLTHRTKDVSLTDFPSLDGQGQTREAVAFATISSTMGPAQYVTVHVEGDFPQHELPLLVASLREAADRLELIAREPAMRMI